MTETETNTQEPFAEWCIVELLGHRRLAGHVKEIQLAGAGFLRDVSAEDVHDDARDAELDELKAWEE